MSYKDHFPSRYLKVDDLKGRKLALTISAAGAEEVGLGADKQNKLVVHFKETKKGMVMNRVNADTVAELIGSDEEQDWIGHRIVLVPAKTEFQGKRVACIRVEEAGAATLPAAPTDLYDHEFDDDPAGGVQ